MSGSIASIAAYDGTGTQGYGTTDKNSEDAKSIFWNEKDTNRYYVNGCSFSEVSSNKAKITSPETVIFTFDNDSDAINDLTLVIEREGLMNRSTNTPQYYMLYFIDRIEVCIGNQVICTLNTAQLVKEFFDTGDYSLFTNFQPKIDNTSSTGVSAQKINLNIFRIMSNNGIDSSYLMSCANNQTMQVKVYPQNFTKDNFNNYVNGDVNNDVQLTDLTSPEFKFSLYSNKYSITNAERDFLRNQVIPKRTNITQFAELTLKPSGTILKKGTPITISCDHFNLYTSNLYILGLCHNGISTLNAFDVELYLNSISFLGIFPYYLGFNQPNVPFITEASSDRFFYYKIPIAKNYNMKETDQDYVPFSKFDSIRVILTPKEDITIANHKDFFNTLTVVSEGKCTALYQDGAVVFNNY